MGSINHIFSLLCQFERIKDGIKIFTSKKNADNQLLIFIYSIGAEVISLLKLNTYSYLYSLIDITGLDLTKLKNYNLFFNTDVAHMQPMFFERCVIYNVMDYNNNGRYLFTYFMPKNFNNVTLSEIFFNAN